MTRTICRREFMKGTAYATLVAMVGAPARAQGRSRVVLIRDEHVWKADGSLDAQIIQRMVDEAVTTLFEVSDPLEAFRRVVKPDDTVGIKTNTWQFLPTPRELEQAIERRVLEAGVDKSKLDMADRGLLGNRVFMGATALINMRPLRTHYWAGIGGCLKNLITFTPQPSDYHGDSCADMASFWKLPQINGKVRLNVLSVLNPLFHGRGPHHFDQRYVWKYHGLIVGTDPVAVDAVGLELINAKRLAFFGNRRELQTSPKHVMMADARHHLGNADLKNIDLVRLGWKGDVLI